jgi:hypothetical protein
MDSELPPDLPPSPAPEPAATAPWISDKGGRPWGFWATLAWSVIIAAGYVIAQSAAVFVFLLIDTGVGNLHHLDLQELISNGKIVGLSVLASAPVVVALCIGAALARRGISIKDYFALRWPRWRVIAAWLAVFLVYMTVVDWLLKFIKGDATEKFMTDVLQSAGWMMPILLFAIAVGAPISEEFFFRGFLYAGLKDTCLRPIGTIVATSLLFASIHLQYDLQGSLFVLLAGLFFGVARWKTDSLWMPILLHSFMNIVATIGQFAGK